MTIDRSGTWWRGTEAEDLDEYLVAFTANGRRVGPVVHVRCAACDGTEFGVEVDDLEGCARRTCHGCASSHVMLDSDEYVEDADLEGAACPCGGETFEVAAGFALGGDGEVRWVYVALRCVADGVLGVYTDWKIDYSPTAGLLTSA